MNIQPEINTRDKTVLTIVPKFDVYPHRFFFFRRDMPSNGCCAEWRILKHLALSCIAAVKQGFRYLAADRWRKDDIFRQLSLFD